MSGFLDSLIERTLTTGPAEIQPQLPSLFEAGRVAASTETPETGVEMTAPPSVDPWTVRELRPVIAASPVAAAQERESGDASPLSEAAPRNEAGFLQWQRELAGLRATIASPDLTPRSLPPVVSGPEGPATPHPGPVPTTIEPTGSPPRDAGSLLWQRELADLRAEMALPRPSPLLAPAPATAERTAPAAVVPGQDRAAVGPAALPPSQWTEEPRATPPLRPIPPPAIEPRTPPAPVESGFGAERESPLQPSPAPAGERASVIPRMPGPERDESVQQRLTALAREFSRWKLNSADSAASVPTRLGIASERAFPVIAPLRAAPPAASAPQESLPPSAPPAAVPQIEARPQAQPEHSVTVSIGRIEIRSPESRPAAAPPAPPRGPRTSSRVVTLEDFLSRRPARGGGTR